MTRPMFNAKTLLITGGTGTFGNAVLHRYLESDIAEIRIFSRDEKKQEEMRTWVDQTTKDFESKTTYQVGYEPPKAQSGTTSTTQ